MRTRLAVCADNARFGAFHLSIPRSGKHAAPPAARPDSAL